MSKKFTVMFYNSENYGKTRILNISKQTIVVIIGLISFLLVGSIFSIFLNYRYSKEIDSLELLSGENIDMVNQIANYSNQLDQINQKVVMLDELEYRVRDLVSDQKGETLLRPVAVGGNEMDILRGYFAVADRREKEFFDSLSSSLTNMSSRLDKHEKSLTELAQFLEEQQITMLSTPTIWPVRGWVSSKFGFRKSPFSGRISFHEGLDIAARYGVDVTATAKGVIVYSGVRAGYGYMVTIDHGYGFMTRYAHNSKLLVRVGDKVQKGDSIAKVGTSGRSTGPHVHYEVLSNGVPVNPIKFIIDEGNM